MGDSWRAEEKPMKGEKTPRREQEAVAKLLVVLEEDPLSRSAPEILRKVAQRLFPNMDIEKVAKRAVREAHARTAEAIEALRKDLGIPTDPSDRELKHLALEIRDTLRRGLRVEARSDYPGGIVFYVCEKGERPVGCLCESKRRFRSRGGSLSKSFRMIAEVGWVETYAAGGLVLQRERAFLRAVRPEQVEEALAETRSLPSFLAALGLSELEGALVALSKLEDGEVRQEGSYLLVREGNTRILRRGALFGSPDLDAAFLTEKRVTLSYPRGLEIALKGETMYEKDMLLREFALRFEGEEARYERGPSFNLAGDFRYQLASHMRGVLRDGLKEASRLPKMRALVEELAGSEDPLEAPKDEAFFRRVELRLLAKL